MTEAGSLGTKHVQTGLYTLTWDSNGAAATFSFDKASPSTARMVSCWSSPLGDSCALSGLRYRASCLQRWGHALRNRTASGADLHLQSSKSHKLHPMVTPPNLTASFDRYVLYQGLAFRSAMLDATMLASQKLLTETEEDVIKPSEDESATCCWYM